MFRLLAGFCFSLALLLSAEAEALPVKPANYFNDYAGVVSQETVRRLDGDLRQFERDTSNQIVVAVYPKLESPSSVQEFTVRVAESWKVGQAGRDNGAVLFVFIAERQMFLQVGYGLEGALPDITAKQIIENEIKPAFRTGDYDAGLTAGVTAMLQATRGEYRGTGRVRDDSSGLTPLGMIIIGFILLLFVVQIVRGMRRGVVYSPRGRRYAVDVWPNVSLGGGGWSGGSGRSGGSGGGGGGFSGGGGSFGGGGAGGSW